MGIAIRKRNKKNIGKRKRWSRHHSLLWKTMEKPRKGKGNDLRTKDEFRSRLRVEKVLAPPPRLS